MIISRAPYRVSFFGGGTDYPEWFQEHGGVFLSSAIDHHINIILRRKPSLDMHPYRIVWRELEEVQSIDAIKHPFVRAALTKRKSETGLDVVYFGQLPHGAGIGSSSSFGVAFLTALNALTGYESTKYDMAKEVIEIEHDILKETVGVQDQFASTFGGLNFGRIDTNGHVSLEQINLSGERLHTLNKNLIFAFTGISRKATEVAQSKVSNFKNKQSALHEMYKMAFQAKDILTSTSDLDDFGLLMNESWKLKRSLSEQVSTSFVDDIYERALQAGALGGKLLGAGGGGFMLFYVPDGAHDAVSKALEPLAQVPISLDADGAQIVMNSPSKYSEHYDRVWSLAGK